MFLSRPLRGWCTRRPGHLITHRQRYGGTNLMTVKVIFGASVAFFMKCVSSNLHSKRRVWIYYIRKFKKVCFRK